MNLKKKLVLPAALCLVMLINSVLYGADKVVVVPLGSSVKTATQTLYYNLPVSAFTPVLYSDTSPRGNFVSGDWFSLLSPQLLAGMAAPVQLPDNSVIKDFTCYVYDNDGTESISGNSPAYLWRRSVNDVNRERITDQFNMPTAGSADAVQAFSTQSILFPQIDTSDYFYGAYVLFKITGNPASYTNLRFYGCRIAYDLDVVVP